MATASITKRTVDAAKPAAADYTQWDDEVSGFGLKVTPMGSKVYIYRYRLARPGQAAQTAPRKYTIGKHGNLTPDQARKRAKELAAMVAQGIDPRQAEINAIAVQDEVSRQAEVKARLDADLAFENVAARWLEEYELGRKPRSYGQAKLVINKHLMPILRGKPLPSITRADLQGILDGIPAKQRASRRTVYAYTSIFWNWAVQRGDISQNPVLTMAKPKAVKARDRVLTDDELVMVYRATEALRAPLGAYYRVLLLTGQRRAEVAGMDWAELDRASTTWIIPAARAKNGAAHIVPLAAAVVAELDRLALALEVKSKAAELETKLWPKAGPVMSFKGMVALSCFSQAKTLLDAEVAKVRKDSATIEPWRVHDLRRSVATGLQRLGVRFEVTEATLNHVSGAKGGVAGIYQRHDWRDEKQSALEAWARHVAAIIAPAEKTNVVPINTAKQIA